MYCWNCGYTSRFVLVLELTVLVTPEGTLSNPDWALALECAACASTDVSGDPVSLLQSRTGSFDD